MDVDNGDKYASGTPPTNTPHKNCTDGIGFEGGQEFERKSTARRPLTFIEGEISNKNVSSSTQGNEPHSGPIGIRDGDDDVDNAPMAKRKRFRRRKVPNRVESENESGDDDDDDDVNTIPVLAKRKRVGRRKVPNRVTSESENNDDDDDDYDNITLSRLWSKHDLNNAPILKKSSVKTESENNSDDDDDDIPLSRLQSKHDLNNAPILKNNVSRIKPANTVTGESNNDDDDDNIPLSRLWSNDWLTCNSDDHLNENPTIESCSTDNVDERSSKLRRLVRGRDREDKGTLEKCSNEGTDTMNDNMLEDEMVEDESSDSFIVHSSNDVSENHGTPSSVDGDSGQASESSLEYDEIISKLRRERKDKTKWENEVEMRADFGKNPELCMKAVCVLYQEEMSKEQSRQATIKALGLPEWYFPCRERERRGFSLFDVSTGSKLAEFLTDANGDGDGYGDVKKTVQQLLEYDPKGVDHCERLAMKYSTQLFRIYESGLVPFFHP